jgi:hypothetical protein
MLSDQRNFRFEKANAIPWTYKMGQVKDILTAIWPDQQVESSADGRAAASLRG